MGRKRNWFSNVKKALSPKPKETKDEKLNKSRKKWFGKQKLQTSVSYSETDRTTALLPPEEVVISQYHVVEVATNVDIEGPIPSVLTTAAEVQAPTIVQFSSKPKDVVAAIKIQTAFRGYLARRALRSIRGLVRLKSLMEGPVVRRQVVSTLRTMQTLGHMQSQIRSRRLRMLEENQAREKQLLQKHKKELESMRIEEEWDASILSKEQIEAKLLSKYEAAVRRERSLAYSFSHQKNCKNTSRSINPIFMDPTNPSWGWNWLERLMAAHPWGSHSLTEKEKNDHSTCSITSAEISKSFARFHLNSEKQHSPPMASQNPGSPNSQQSHSNPPKPAPSAVARKPKKASSKGIRNMDDEIDTKSVVNSIVRPDRFRRHSIGGSTARDDDDDESLASPPTVPSYMVATKSAKAKSMMMMMQLQSPDSKSFVAAKKQLAFAASPARPRRHSGPPKVETSFNAEVTEKRIETTEIKVGNV